MLLIDELPHFAHELCLNGQSNEDALCQESKVFTVASFPRARIYNLKSQAKLLVASNHFIVIQNRTSLELPFGHRNRVIVDKSGA